MARSRKVEHIVVLKSKFKHEEKSIWFGRARLLQDRIILKGLGYKEIIPLDRISELRWIDDRITIVTDDGTEYPLIIRSAAIWKYEIQARTDMSDNTLGKRLPGDVDHGKDGRAETDSSAQGGSEPPPRYQVNKQYTLDYETSGDASEVSAGRTGGESGDTGQREAGGEEAKG